VSTRLVPRRGARRPDFADGFVVLVEGGRGRIVAEGLGFTNECRLDPSGAWLYVVETFARRISRFPRENRGGLGARETWVELGEGNYPDGIAFDAEGALWATSIFSNRLLRVTPDRKVTVMIEDHDPAYWRRSTTITDRTHGRHRFYKRPRAHARQPVESRLRRRGITDDLSRFPAQARDPPDSIPRQGSPHVTLGTRGADP
jgi:hypothetical protein